MVELTNKEYRQKEGLSASEIKQMAKSMALWKYHHDNPEEGNDSKALLFGRSYHKLVLEPDTFFEEFAVLPSDIDRRTKSGKEKYAEFLEEAKNKDVISGEDFAKISDMRDALFATPYARKLLYGQHEQSFFWQNDETGLICKCRPDSFGKIGRQGIIVDLKTCQCAETEAFMRDAMKLSYDIQAAHYIEGMKQNTNDDFVFIFIAQEKNPPYLVNILQADEDFVRLGQETRIALMDQYNKCVERNEFPGYMGYSDEANINSLGIPGWIKKALDSTEIEMEE